ncbi:hypothetical protein [Embleya sp. NPDC059237]|uniref:hypothetical protein n=1 Tax=Embleya sp. NPDC059237 TaxID=3346784 RepID=UPI0036A4AE40
MTDVMSEPVQDSAIEDIIEAAVDGRWIDELVGRVMGYSEWITALTLPFAGRQIHHTVRAPRPPLQPGAVHR